MARSDLANDVIVTNRAGIEFLITNYGKTVGASIIQKTVGAALTKIGLHDWMFV